MLGHGLCRTFPAAPSSTGRAEVVSLESSITLTGVPVSQSVPDRAQRQAREDEYDNPERLRWKPYGSGAPGVARRQSTQLVESSGRPPIFAPSWCTPPRQEEPAMPLKAFGRGSETLATR